MPFDTLLQLFAGDQISAVGAISVSMLHFALAVCAADFACRKILGCHLHTFIRRIVQRIVTQLRTMEAIRRSPQQQVKPDRIDTVVDALLRRGLAVVLAVSALQLIVTAGIATARADFSNWSVLAFMGAGAYALLCCWYAGFLRASASPSNRS